MTTIILKLFQKDEYTWQLKNGRKVIRSFGKCSKGWSSICQTFETLEKAVAYVVQSEEDMAEAFGRKIKIEVSNLESIKGL